jgi:hypothetical protein
MAGATHRDWSAELPQSGSGAQLLGAEIDGQIRPHWAAPFLEHRHSNTPLRGGAGVL